MSKKKFSTTVKSKRISLKSAAAYVCLGFIIGVNTVLLLNVESDSSSLSTGLHLRRDRVWSRSLSEENRRLGVASDGTEAVSDAAQCISGYGGDSAGGTYASGAPVSTVTKFTSHSDANFLVTTHGTLPRPMNMRGVGATEIFPCNHYSGNSCANNVLAQEIQMGYDHFFDVGGSGAGRPRLNGKCRLHALTYYTELTEYFCMFANPKAPKFFGCCDTTCPRTTEGEQRYQEIIASGKSASDAEAQLQQEHINGHTMYDYDRAYAKALREIPVLPKGAQFTDEAIASAKATAEAEAGKAGQYYHRECGKTCFGPDGKPTTASTVIDSSPTCTKDNVNVIRVCKSFAEKAWLKNRAFNTYVPPGAKYDGCGVLIWIGIGDDDKSPKNPNDILSWGDVDGGSGDDPVIPGELWGDFETFARDTKPPLFDEFVVVVVPDEGKGNCFAGRGNHYANEYQYPYGT